MGRADQKPETDRYCVSPRTLCFITCGDEILLLRGSPGKPIWPNQYNGVGGHIEAREDVQSAALREIREETGLEVEDLKLCGVVNIPVDASSLGVMLFVFTAVADVRESRSSREGLLKCVDIDHLVELDLVEDLPTLIPRVLGMKPTDPPFFALYQYDELDQLRIIFAPRPP